MTDPKTQIADAALKLLGTCGWSDLKLMEVARRANVDPATLQASAANKPALLGIILNRIGSDTATRYRSDSVSDDPRDRLLDVALTWFEVLNKHKPAVRALYEGLKRDPLSVIAAHSEIIGAAEWLLALAEADTGPAIPARALALAGVMARAIPVWLDDDAEMAQTMARLDGDLRRASDMFGWLRKRSAGAARADQPPRSNAAAEKATPSGKVSKSGNRRRSRARNPARRRS